VHLNPATGEWIENTVKEGVPPGASQRGPPLVLRIGGPVPEGAPRIPDAPPAQLLGVSGTGVNAVGKFSWVGAYWPRTGELCAFKSYAVKPAPAVRAPLSTFLAEAIGSAVFALVMLRILARRGL